MDAPATLSVSYFYDAESRQWGFTSSDPAIVGGGDRTLEAAARHFARVLADTLRWGREDMTESEQQAPAALAGAAAR